jgi:transposase
MIDARLVADSQEEITPGEAVAGMIINGLGFGNRPLSLTPQFFANKPLDLWFREDVCAELFNRFTLGRTLDEVYAYGGDLLLSEIALAVWPTKALTCASIISTRPAFPCAASPYPRAMSRPSPSPMVTPKPTVPT